MNHPFPIDRLSFVFFKFSDDIGDHHLFAGFIHFDQIERADQIVPALNGKSFENFESKRFSDHYELKPAF